MKEQSGVDFLHSKILFNIGLDDNDIFKLRELVKIAKKLENKQHGKTWDTALDNYEVRAGNYMRAYGDFDDYYNETYEINGSDDHLPNVRKMVASVQKLIDKDIFNQAILAMEEMYGSGCDAEIDAYFRGAKWMREELNKQV